MTYTVGNIRYFFGPEIQTAYKSELRLWCGTERTGWTRSASII